MDTKKLNEEMEQMLEKEYVDWKSAAANDDFLEDDDYEFLRGTQKENPYSVQEFSLALKTALEAIDDAKTQIDDEDFGDKESLDHVRLSLLTIQQQCDDIKEACDRLTKDM